MVANAPHALVVDANGIARQTKNQQVAMLEIGLVQVFLAIVILSLWQFPAIIVALLGRSPLMSSLDLQVQQKLR